MIEPYGKCFATCSDEMKFVKNFEYKMEQIEDKIIYETTSRYTLDKLDITKAWVQDGLANGILRRSVSPHSYRLVIVTKKKIPG